MRRILLLFGMTVLTLGNVFDATAGPQSKLPNILWITSEDNGPHLGCYGDDYADTPHIDRLAAGGFLYRNAWSNAPVCAPARTTLISGLYPPSTGAEHMRSQTVLPAGMKMYPQYLRERGYYCTNNRKEDYNLEKPGKVWDESGRNAHWKNRQPDQPFFAIFNFTISHESQIRKRPHKAVHDPSQVRVPAYHPDRPEVRQDWAQYYDKLTEMDQLVGKTLAELEQAGLSGETIVFYYADHGSGMPRNKRSPCNSGLHVPLIVHVPEQYQELAPRDYASGASTQRLVGFIDLAPTLLSIAGIQPPTHMQGHAFMGRFDAPEQPYLYGFRGRMDERYDMARSVRDKRFVYVRNFMPHRPAGQYLQYMFQTPTTQVWKAAFDAGQLNDAQSAFWQLKPREELYDLKTDPDEVYNLADVAEHQETLGRLRRAQRELALRIRDVGYLPEHEIHARSKDSTPYQMGHDPEKYPIERVISAAELASSRNQADVPALLEGLHDEESAVRYWAAMGLLIRGESAVLTAREALRQSLDDVAGPVRIAAGEALGRYGNTQEIKLAVATLLELADVEKQGIYLAVAALNALDQLDANAAGARSAIESLPQQHPSVPRRMSSYLNRLVTKTLTDLP